MILDKTETHVIDGIEVEFYMAPDSEAPAEMHMFFPGLKPDEVAEALHLPAELEREWSCRGYYGALKHKAKAIYQRYLSWYDANPVHLDPLPGAASARKMIAYMGGAEAILAKAREDYARGEFRWSPLGPAR
ncbi:alkyl sulfatase dimerization domain-containing protein [Pseudoprimorskyibacter insulae]|uniref:alkyl sulfatase dimerization domain-containing protein n=1 Tax=Pseudoprimorskyibacter insulae TaxID=1695997 RepID=UPI0015E84FB2|nr:alkyl sulfatase dimerization domain-containing protein [Pseudoprimorskyibacter insulae]